IAREAEAAMFHRQVFEDLRRNTPHSTDPAEAIAIGAVEASFKILASAFIVLTGSGSIASSVLTHPLSGAPYIPDGGGGARLCEGIWLEERGKGWGGVERSWGDTARCGEQPLILKGFGCGGGVIECNPTPLPWVALFLSVHTHGQIAREAEAAMFHRQLFEELRRSTHLTRDPSEAAAIGAVESSLKCCASAIIVLTKTGRYTHNSSELAKTSSKVLTSNGTEVAMRSPAGAIPELTPYADRQVRAGHKMAGAEQLWGGSAHLISRYRPRAPIIAVTRNGQTARQCHLYRGIFPVLYTKPSNDVWAEDVDLRVNFAMEMGKARGFFKEGDVVIVLTGWRPGSGYTNTMRSSTHGGTRPHLLPRTRLLPIPHPSSFTLPQQSVLLLGHSV
ncbi:hypothetical protein JZ751_009282, partial [Albula glossodonta]